jgi:negative regulator of flagellin synthesis FlgM
MKIDTTINPAGTSSAGTPAPAGSTAAAPAPGAADPGANTVNLSALSSHMQSVSASLASTPVVNQAHVDEIKQAIASGQFKVNPEAVADKLIDTVREMINNKSSS